MPAAQKHVIEKYHPEKMGDDLSKKSRPYTWYSKGTMALIDGLPPKMGDTYEAAKDDISVQLRFTAPKGQTWDKPPSANEQEEQSDRNSWGIAALLGAINMVDRLWSGAVSKSVTPKTDEAYEVVGFYVELNLETDGWMVELILTGGEGDTHMAFTNTAKLDSAQDAEAGFKIDPAKFVTGQEIQRKTFKGGHKVKEDKAALFVRYDEPIYEAWEREAEEESLKAKVQMREDSGDFK